MLMTMTIEQSTVPPHEFLAYWQEKGRRYYYYKYKELLPVEITFPAERRTYHYATALRITMRDNSIFFLCQGLPPRWYRWEYTALIASDEETTEWSLGANAPRWWWQKDSETLNFETLKGEGFDPKEIVIQINPFGFSWDPTATLASYYGRIYHKRIFVVTDPSQVAPGRGSRKLNFGSELILPERNRSPLVLPKKAKLHLVKSGRL